MPSTDRCRPGRRRVLSAGLALTAFATAAPALALELALTPGQTPGPFYPNRLPLDSDNDLVAVAGRAQGAAGTVSHVMGRVLDSARDPRNAEADRDFQGYGRTVSGDDGAYRFRTIAPVPYPGRAPHIHFALSGPGLSGFTTQMYIAGHPLNERDFVLSRIPDGPARQSLMVEFGPGEAIEPGTRLANFDIVLGG